LFYFFCKSFFNVFGWPQLNRGYKQIDVVHFAQQTMQQCNNCSEQIINAAHWSEKIKPFRENYAGLPAAKPRGTRKKKQTISRGTRRIKNSQQNAPIIKKLTYTTECNKNKTTKYCKRAKTHTEYYNTNRMP